MLRHVITSSPAAQKAYTRIVVSVTSSAFVAEFVGIFKMFRYFPGVDCPGGRTFKRYVDREYILLFNDPDS